MKTKNNKCLKLGETYRFMGYDWTVCELVNNGRTAVIQSHGVTHGVWPGFKMEKNDGHYSNSIDGKDISAYDDKMRALYDVIKNLEDKSAPYGKGLYLISREKVGFAKLGEPGFGNYWQALKTAARNFSLFGTPNDHTCLGTVSGNDGVLGVSSDGGIYCGGSSQDYDYVIAPAFNIDLSKVTFHSLSARNSLVNNILLFMKRVKAVLRPNRKNKTPYDRDVCQFTDDSGDAEYRACEHVLGEGFDKTETWIIKSMFTANHESRTVEHPEKFSSEQKAWNKVKSLALADQDDKEVAEVRYNKDACEAMVIYSDKTFCKFFAKKTDTPETLPLDGNTWEKQKAATLELGKTYRLAGYNWTACELINNGKTLVIQSHGVTAGAWPGLEMAQFGNGNYYTNSIDGEDISAYDNKMKELYDAIKDVEDTSASYGNGLYLVSREKAGFTEWGKSGSGNYWQALKEAAGNARSFGASSNGAWLGTVSGSCNPLCVDSNGGVYTSNLRNSGFVVAPAFNLDLSKVEVAGDEIVIKETYEKTNTGSLALEKRVKKARLILAVTEQVSEDNFERHYKTVEIEVPENEHMNLSKCDIIGGEWIS